MQHASSQLGSSTNGYRLTGSMLGNSPAYWGVHRANYVERRVAATFGVIRMHPCGQAMLSCRNTQERALTVQSCRKFSSRFGRSSRNTRTSKTWLARQDDMAGTVLRAGLKLRELHDQCRTVPASGPSTWVSHPQTPRPAPLRNNTMALVWTRGPRASRSWSEEWGCGNHGNVCRT